MNTFFSRLRHSPIFRCVAIGMVALGCSSLAFCGEIHDAARRGDLERVKTLLKDHPELTFSIDEYGETPLHLAASTRWVGAVQGHKGSKPARDSGNKEVQEETKSEVR